MISNNALTTIKKKPFPGWEESSVTSSVMSAATLTHFSNHRGLLGANNYNGQKLDKYQ